MNSWVYEWTSSDISTFEYIYSYPCNNVSISSWYNLDMFTSSEHIYIAIMYMDVWLRYIFTSSEYIYVDVNDRDISKSM